MFILSKEYEKINKIVVELTTGKKRQSSTYDHIELSIGSHKWLLDKPHHHDFEKGKTDIYELDVPEGMDASWFRYFCLIKKTISGGGDDWQLVKLVVKINDNIVYERYDLDVWLKDDKLDWCAPGFDYGRAGE